MPRSDVAEEDHHSFVGGADLEGEPSIQGLGIEALELAGDLPVHGSVIVKLELLCGEGQLLPDVPAGEISVECQKIAGLAIEKGEAMFAIDADDTVCRGLQHLQQPFRGRFSKQLGAFVIGDIAEDEGDAFRCGNDVDVVPAIAVGTEVFEVRRHACLHDRAVLALEFGTDETGKISQRVSASICRDSTLR